MPVEGAAPPLRSAEGTEVAEPPCESEPFVVPEPPVLAVLTEVRWACGSAGLTWADLTMMAANSSGSVSRPLVLMVSWNCWARSAGGWPIWPAATWTFCWAMAVTTSMAPSPRAASRAGSSQARRL
jgi:hypothetical protein